MDELNLVLSLFILGFLVLIYFIKIRIVFKIINVSIFSIYVGWNLISLFYPSEPSSLMGTYFQIPIFILIHVFVLLLFFFADKYFH